MVSSCIVDDDGKEMGESEVVDLYGDADDGTIVRTYSGTVYRLCGDRGYHKKWSGGSIFREAKT